MGGSKPDSLEPKARSPLAELLVVAAPVVMTMTSYTVMQFIDALMVTRIGDDDVYLAAQSNGGIVMWMAFRNEDGTTGGRLLGGFAGLLAIGLAVALVANPLAGLFSLPLTVASLLVVIGGARIWIGFRMQNGKRPGWEGHAGGL